MIMHRCISRVRSSARCFQLTCFALAILGASATTRADDDDPTRGEAAAPDNTTPISTTLGGAYFADKDLVKRSDILKTQLRRMREQIEKGDITTATASARLANITAELITIRAAIDRKQVLVEAFHVYTKTEETLIDLGDSRLLVITADAVDIRGWEGPGIKCVLKKSIVAKQQPSDDQFAAIKVDHRLQVAEEMLGETRQKREQREREFMASEKGRDLTPDQLVARKNLLSEISGSKAKYEPFQGKPCHMVEVAGLENKYVSMKLHSTGGTTTHSSRRQFHAKLTILVPELDHLCVRGCQVSLDISGVDCDLLLTTDGSHDRDYEGSFVVRDVKGNVMIDQAPVRELMGVSGNVDIEASTEFVNSGTHHGGGTRTASPFETQSTSIRDIGGDLTAWFLRSDLSVGKISGAIDVRNDYGDTIFALDETLDSGRAHRILSESGAIALAGKAALLKKSAIYAHTACGTLHTNLKREALDDVDFTTGWPRRAWSGFVTPSQDRFSFAKFERPAKALDNRDRAAGIDLISMAGSVRIMAEK
jgi:hypothetical protein